MQNIDKSIDNEAFDLISILKIFLRYKVLMIIIIVFFTALSSIYALSKPSTYESTAKIILGDFNGTNIYNPKKFKVEIIFMNDFSHSIEIVGNRFFNITNESDSKEKSKKEMSVIIQALVDDSEKMINNLKKTYTMDREKQILKKSSEMESIENEIQIFQDQYEANYKLSTDIGRVVSFQDLTNDQYASGLRRELADVKYDVKTMTRVDELNFNLSKVTGKVLTEKVEQNRSRTIIMGLILGVVFSLFLVLLVQSFRVIKISNDEY